MLRDIIAVMIILYISLIRPRVPDIVVSLFDSRIFRILMLTLIVYVSRQNMRFSVLLAIGFVVVVAVIKEQIMYEGFIEGMEDMKPVGTSTQTATPTTVPDVKPTKPVYRPVHKPNHVHVITHKPNHVHVVKHVPKNVKVKPTPLTNDVPKPMPVQKPTPVPSAPVRAVNTKLKRTTRRR
jgi:hypothetical protein